MHENIGEDADLQCSHKYNSQTTINSGALRPHPCEDSLTGVPVRGRVLAWRLKLKPRRRTLFSRWSQCPCRPPPPPGSPPVPPPLSASCTAVAVADPVSSPFLPITDCEGTHGSCSTHATMTAATSPLARRPPRGIVKPSATDALCSCCLAMANRAADMRDERRRTSNIGSTAVLPQANVRYSIRAQFASSSSQGPPARNAKRVQGLHSLPPTPPPPHRQSPLSPPTKSSCHHNRRRRHVHNPLHALIRDPQSQPAVAAARTSTARARFEGQAAGTQRSTLERAPTCLLLEAVPVQWRPAPAPPSAPSFGS